MQLVIAMLLLATIQAPHQPNIEQIRAKMFERLAIDSQRQVKGATWVKERIDEDINNPLKIKVEHREQYRVWGNGVKVLQQKMVRDGKSVNEKPEPLPFFLEPALLARFEFFLTEPVEVPCGEHQCWRLSFAPKPDEVDDSNDVEHRMFATSIGTILVDTTSYAMVRIESHIATAYRSFLYDVDWSTVTITQELNHGTMVVATIEMSFQYHTLFGSQKTKRRFYRTLDVVFPPS